MNNDTVTGKLDQAKGKIKQTVGEAVGNERLANSGAADQVKGAVKEAWGNTKDAAHAVSKNVPLRNEARVSDARARAAAQTHETGHSVRESITNAAQNVKKTINEHADKVKRDHSHV
jgi:uncharacterized protein YjbJ (UPF0337 family)